MNFEEFKKYYAIEIEDLELTDKQIEKGFEIYQEDPHEFHPNMLNHV